MLKVLKTVSAVLSVYLSLLLLAGAAERAMLPEVRPDAAVSTAATGGGDRDESVSTITAATLPAGAIALYRNYSNPDYARVVQRNVRYAIGGIIKGASIYGSLVSERMELLLDGIPCSTARYCYGYYVIATRRILI